MRGAAILAVTLTVIGITLYLAYRKEAKGPAARRVIVLLIMVALLQAANAYLAYLGTRPPTTPGIFEDSFARVPLFPYDTRFTILNADEGLWSRPDQEDCLTLWTHRGDTWGKRGEHREPKNIVVRECTAEKLEVSATVRSFAPIADWQQGGVIVFADLDNYVRVTLATWQSGTPPKQIVGAQAVFERASEPFLVKNVPFHTSSGAEQLASDGPLENYKLRITRDQKSWRAQYYDPHAFQWIDVADAQYDLHPRFAGVLAFHGDSYRDGRAIELEPRPVDFDAFRIAP